MAQPRINRLAKVIRLQKQMLLAIQAPNALKEAVLDRNRHDTGCLATSVRDTMITTPAVAHEHAATRRRILILNRRVGRRLLGHGLVARDARGADQVKLGGGAPVIVVVGPAAGAAPAPLCADLERLAKDGLVGAGVGPARALVDENVPEQLGVNGERVAVVGGRRGAVCSR